MGAGRKVAKNLLSLSFAEIANKGMVFFTTFYLARVINPNGFGINGDANAYLVYFVFIVNLGFSQVGMREISKNKSIINSYVNSIVSIRLILSFISFFALCVMAYYINKSFEYRLILFILGFNLFSTAILLDWVYQGLEKMEIIALRQIITSFLNLVGIIIFVKNPKDLTIAIVVTVFSTALNSIWTFLYYVKNYGKVSLKIDKSLIKSLFSSSIYIAISYFFIALYSNIGINMLGFMRSNQETGYYVAALKFMQFAFIPLAIIQNALMPYLSRATNLESRNDAMMKLTKMTAFSGSLVVSLFITYSYFLISYTYGVKYIDSAPIMNILMITCILAHITISYTVALISWGEEKKLIIAISTGAVVNLSMNYFLIPKYGAIGAALAFAASELAVVISQGFIFYSITGKLHLLIFFKLMSFGLINYVLGQLLLSLGVPAIVCIIISIIIFLSLTFLFKIVTISELKGYLKK